MIYSLDFVHDFVDINAITVGFCFVVAISASIQEDFVLLVFLGIQHVVAFLEK